MIDDKELFRYCKAIADDELDDDELGELYEEDPEEELPQYMVDAGLLYDTLCSSSYSAHFRLPDNERVPLMICVPMQSGLFTAEDILSQEVLVGSEAHIAQYLDKELYEVIFFTHLSEPKDWIGFAAFTYQEDADNETYKLDVCVEMIYVRSKYRREGIACIIARETARRIAERRSHDENFTAKYGITSADVSLRTRTKDALQSEQFRQFSDNLQFMLLLELEPFENINPNWSIGTL